jgi:hypothetical protein
MSMKNSNGTIGNRTRDLPVCSAVRQQTAPPRAPNIAVSKRTLCSGVCFSNLFSKTCKPEVFASLLVCQGKF